MKKIFLLSLFTFCILHSTFPQNPLVKEWDYRFGGTRSDELFSVQQTADGGFILGGCSRSGIGGDKTYANWDTSRNTIDYWIVKTDSLGIKQWDKDFGGTSEDLFTSLQQTTDGGYILGGYSLSGIGGDKTQAAWINSFDYWIVKVDSTGNKEWDKVFGGTDIDVLYSVKETRDKGYILGGYSYSEIGGDKTQDNWDATGLTHDYWIVKVDSVGNKQWDKVFGGIEDDVLYSLQQTNDGGYILGGNSNSEVSGDKTQPTWGSTDFWIVKTDSLGIKQWDKDFGTTDGALFSSLIQTPDGGYVLGGLSSGGISGDKTQPSVGNYDYWIVKIDSLGIKLWDKDFGGTDVDWFYSLYQTKEHGFMLAGNSSSNAGGDKTENNLGGNQSWVVKTDSLGNKQWDKTLLINSGTGGGIALQTWDGCYVMANCNYAPIGGDKTQASWGDMDYWLIKFCDSTLNVGSDKLKYENIFSISPNPTRIDFTIKLNSEIKNELIEVYSVLGEKVYSTTVTKQQTITNKFPSGIYFVKVTDGEKHFTAKLIVQ